MGYKLMSGLLSALIMLASCKAINGGGTRLTEVNIQNAYNTAMETYEIANKKVAALPSGSKDEKLRQVAFQWALDQSKQMIDSGLNASENARISDAQSILNDIRAFPGFGIQSGC